MSISRTPPSDIHCSDHFYVTRGLKNIDGSFDDYCVGFDFDIYTGDMHPVLTAPYNGAIFGRPVFCV